MLHLFRRSGVAAAAIITGLGTLLGRVLGLARDVATAAVFGLSQGPVLDALVIALRVPNLFRALLGEGALASAYLPVFTAVRAESPPRAWSLATAVFVRLSLALLAVIIIGELCYAIVWTTSPAGSNNRLLALLGAIMLPYVLPVCLAVQMATTLTALGRFAMPALAPSLFNVCWLAGLATAAIHWHGQPAIQAAVVAAAVVISGVFQVAVLWGSLRSEGLRFRYAPNTVHEPLQQLGRRLLPLLLGAAAVQINTFLDSMIAWGFSDGGDPQHRLALFGGVRAPLEQGAAAAVYFGERMYWLPLGLLGMALATACFPRLSCHAAEGRIERLSADLSGAVRLMLVAAAPAAVVLVVFSEPLTRLLFERGAFSAADTTRAARVVAAYGWGVPAFCVLPIVLRGFYAFGDTRRPAVMAAITVVVNLCLNLTLIWPWAEVGLAASTSICATLQAITLLWVFDARIGPIDRRGIAATVLRTSVAAGMMGCVGIVARDAIVATSSDDRWLVLAAKIAVMLMTSGSTYAATVCLLGGREWQLLGESVVAPATNQSSEDQFGRSQSGKN